MKFKLKTRESQKTSVWGMEDKDTLHVLKRTIIRGKWINLAASDGRYNLNLLKRADFVIASDIDKIALNKLWGNTPTKYKLKLGIKVFDLTKRFPFKDNYFDGIFSTGTLHLLPRRILPRVIGEMDRVLNKNGKIIIDFATDIKRITADGKQITIGKEPGYKIQEARNLLKKLFKGFRVKTYESGVRPELVKAKIPYKFSCKFIILVANKK
jgi:SAM-dependent methyltransferase